MILGYLGTPAIMQLPINYYLMLGMTLLTPWTSQMKMGMVLSDSSSRNSSDLLSNTLMKLHHTQVIRNKRAVGLLLQGLVQALGYNTTPIQIASIPNTNDNNASSAGPTSIDTRILNQSPMQVQKPNVDSRPPVQSSMTPPRQRETLKFTGVVNFGNNTDLLSHLRQYEMLFHSASTTPPVSSSTAAPNVPPKNPCASNIPSPPQPNSAPIPIDLLPDLRYPRPLLLSIVTASPNVIPLTTESGIHPVNDTIQNDDHSDSEKSNEDDTAEHEDNYEDREDYDDVPNRDREEPDDQDVINTGQENDERNMNIPSKEPERYQIIPNVDSKKTLHEYSTVGSHLDDSQVEKSPFKYPLKYMPNRYTGNSGGFSQKLPIDNEPFHGQLTNSYGESLEHSGKVDESVADYFGRFKNPQSGIFEPPRTDDFQQYGQKLTSTERYFPQPIEVERTRQMYTEEPHVGFKYEEYKLNNNQASDESQAPSFRRNEDDDDSPQNEEHSRTYQLDDDMPNANTQSDKFPSSVMNYETKISHGESPAVQSIPERPFQFHKFSPYYKPIQYIFTPESEENISPKIIAYRTYMKNFTEIDENVRNLHRKSSIPLPRDFTLDHPDSLLRLAKISPNFYHDNQRTTMEPTIDMTPNDY